MSITGTFSNDAAVMCRDWGEALPYTPFINGVAQPTITITAIVDRHPVRAGEDGRTRIQPASLFISRTSATGLLARPNRGDLVLLAWQVGESPKSFRVVNVPEQNDLGGWYADFEASIR